MIPISLGPQAAARLAEGATREWLVADGCGGYAMGTVSGLRTRRYHGLLVVSDGSVARRRLALASLDPVLTWPAGSRLRLGTHEWYSGSIDPAGYRYLERFDLVDGLPRWRWRIGEVVLERKLAMLPGRPCLGVIHKLLAGGPVTLALDVLCTWRDAHAERTAHGPPLRVAQVDAGIEVEAAYRLAGPGFEPAGEWWLGAHHREEAARGLAPQEDLWYAGQFVAELDRPGAVLEVTAWADDLATIPPPASEIITTARVGNRRRADSFDDPVAAALGLAADAFVVTKSSGEPDVVAGYPWFGVWSRDTMISYAGLFLATGRESEGRALLQAYAASLSQGMLINTADTGRIEHNTADGTLWFLHAVDRHVAATGDTDLAAELLPALTGVVETHLAGTRYGIVVDSDGLLRQGAPGEALTWMDARVDGVAVTPRQGKAVEINALWVNGLAGLAGLRQRLGADPSEFRRHHARARASFRRRFRRRTKVSLYDVVDSPDGRDSRVRPNQLLAYSLPHAPLSPAPEVLATVGTRLFTPLGLRSLAPDQPGYRGRHRGGPAQRDRAYHQGTVWPWLIGPYADALRRAGCDTAQLFPGLVAHLGEWGLGSISETAEGDPPHAATGCPFQAWSVAEVLRVWQAEHRR